MIEHHIQKQILRKLGAQTNARFSDIKPSEIENNAFQYHLKQLIAAKIIYKSADGTYELTNKGIGEYVNSHLGPNELATQTHAIFLLAVKNNEQWLLSTRAIKPQQGLTGFLHGEPMWDEAVEDTAARRLHVKTGLTARFQPVGSGYIHITQKSEYSSFVDATLLYADRVTGKEKFDKSYSTFGWYSKDQASHLDLIPSMPYLWDVIEGKASPFFDLHFELSE